MFNDLIINSESSIYDQIFNYIKELILDGLLTSGSKLPSTRELSSILKVSRNSVIKAYEALQDENLIYTVKDKGTFVSDIEIKPASAWSLDWSSILNNYSKYAEQLDIVKHELPYKKGYISFKSIAPDETLFDVEEIKRCFLNRISLDGEKLLNYGYAKGYKPLSEYILKYMSSKGADIENRDILITNGFTEAFELLLSALTEEGDKIICENPTHNTAIKLMRLHKLDILGIGMEKDGMNVEMLRTQLKNNNVKLAYVIPSYHNPTGIVMSHEKRCSVYNALKEFGVPLIEDGFNEELLHLGSHIAPITALDGKGNGVIYAGSLSKILFPGIRVGWILADKKLITVLESVKRSRNIHSSTLDQALLHEYLIGGSFERYMKKIRKYYREKFELAVKLVEKYIPMEYYSGDGGFHIFIKLKGICARKVLEKSYEKGVVFLTGDIFYTDGGGYDSMRLGFSKLSNEEMEKGIQIIGSVIEEITS